MGEVQAEQTAGKGKRLLQLIRQRISTGEWLAGQRLPTERDIAREYGVSRLVVREALYALAHEGILERIQGSGTYVRDSAVDIEAGVAPLVLLYPLREGIELSFDPYHMRLVSGISRVLAGCPNKQMLTLCPLREGQSLSERILPGNWARDLAGGLLLHPGLVSREELKQLARLGVNMVSIGRCEDTEGLSFVDIDNAQGIDMAVSHLIDLGHEQIAFVNGPQDIAYCRDRYAGYSLSLRQHGLPERRELLLEAEPWDMEKARRAVAGLIADGTPFTAVVACGDRATYGCLRALRESGLRVPEDVSLVSYGFYPEIFARTELTMTAVVQPVDEMGAQGAEILRQTVTQRKTVRKLLTPLLVTGESTRPARG